MNAKDITNINNNNSSNNSNSSAPPPSPNNLEMPQQLLKQQFEFSVPPISSLLSTLAEFERNQQRQPLLHPMIFLPSTPQHHHQIPTQIFPQQFQNPNNNNIYISDNNNNNNLLQTASPSQWTFYPQRHPTPMSSQTGTSMVTTENVSHDPNYLQRRSIIETYTEQSQTTNTNDLSTYPQPLQQHPQLPQRENVNIPSFMSRPTTYYSFPTNLDPNNNNSNSNIMMSSGNTPPLPPPPYSEGQNLAPATDYMRSDKENQEGK